MMLSHHFECRVVESIISELILLQQPTINHLNILSLLPLRRNSYINLIVFRPPQHHHGKPLIIRSIDYRRKLTDQLVIVCWSDYVAGTVY